MSFVDAPDIITQLKTQLNASAAWTTAGGGASQIHYPDADLGVAQLYPLAVLSMTRRVTRPFVGVVVTSGDLEILLVDDGTVGAIEALAHAIAAEICTDVGIEGLQVSDISEAQVSTDAQRTDADGDLKQITIRLTYGLEA